jgi:hypothetical protein
MSLNESKWERIVIELKDQKNSDDFQKIREDMESFFSSNQANGIRFINYFDKADTNAEVANILNIIFNVIIAITMFLCFFSLCSSMSANLLD